MIHKVKRVTWLVHYGEQCATDGLSNHCGLRCRSCKNSRQNQWCTSTPVSWERKNHLTRTILQEPSYKNIFTPDNNEIQCTEKRHHPGTDPLILRNNPLFLSGIVQTCTVRDSRTPSSSAIFLVALPANRSNFLASFPDIAFRLDV